MSVTRTPLRNEAIRRREEIADARKVALDIGALVALIAFAFVGWLIWTGMPR
jgi:hypothetical protein